MQQTHLLCVGQTAGTSTATPPSPNCTSGLPSLTTQDTPSQRARGSQFDLFAEVPLQGSQADTTGIPWRAAGGCWAEGRGRAACIYGLRLSVVRRCCQGLQMLPFIHRKKVSLHYLLTDLLWKAPRAMLGL